MSISSISFDRQIGRALFAFGMVAALIASALIPALASAAQLTERSIQLSSSSSAATGVTYEINFTAGSTAAAFVVDFCSNSPVVGETCDAPAGFSAASATVNASSTGFSRTALGTPANNKVLITGDIEPEDTVQVTLDGITNPTDDGTLYARVLTYSAANSAVAAAYTSTAPGDFEDDGSISLFITDTIGVSGAVLETMSFCISGAAIADGCVIDPEDASPSIVLGEDDGSGIIALSSDATSTGSVYTQISTNAASGAIVSLKSTAYGCGGLLRAGAPDGEGCDIAPALTGGIANGQARFGVLLDVSDADGTGTLNALSGYNASTYVLNYTAADAAGVTSTYGDRIFDTDEGTAVNKNAQLTFGARIAPNTPAGTYSTDISLIATGKF